MKVARAIAHRADGLVGGSRSVRSHIDRAMLVNSSHDDCGQVCTWLRVRILRLLIFSFRSTVRAMRVPLGDAAQVLSDKRADQLFRIGRRNIALIGALVPLNHSRPCQSVHLCVFGRDKGCLSQIFTLESRNCLTDFA